MPDAPRLMAGERSRLTELVDRLDTLTCRPWHTRSIELRYLGSIARLADTLHDTATRLLKVPPAIVAPVPTINRALTATEHETLTARLETLLQHIDLLVEEDLALHWTVVAEIQVAAQDLAWHLRQLPREVP